jgi:hypothetical protein
MAVAAAVGAVEVVADEGSKESLLFAAGLTVLHVSSLKTLIVLLGYLVFEWVDERVAFTARLKKLDILDEIIFGWNPSAEDPEQEERGSLNRVKLTGQNQIISIRIAELLKEILRSDGAGRVSFLCPLIQPLWICRACRGKTQTRLPPRWVRSRSDRFQEKASASVFCMSVGTGLSVFLWVSRKVPSILDYEANLTFR